MQRYSWLTSSMLTDKLTMRFFFVIMMCRCAGIAACFWVAAHWFWTGVLWIWQITWCDTDSMSTKCDFLCPSVLLHWWRSSLRRVQWQEESRFKRCRTFKLICSFTMLNNWRSACKAVCLLVLMSLMFYGSCVLLRFLSGERFYSGKWLLRRKNLFSSHLQNHSKST